jgi:DNA-binding transcriptional LysR family regulator
MDIQLAQTFLDIVNTGSFVRAAKRLNVSQTTVSARVRLLESQLGRSLFVRNKAGASLTPAGEQFLRYAQVLVQRSAGSSRRATASAANSRGLSCTFPAG